MTDVTVRVGFVGVGGIAQGHLRNISSNPDSDLIAVCDVAEDRARRAADAYGASSYTSFSEMIEKEDLDALYICVPPYAHGEIETLAAENSVAIFVEKPLSADPQTPEYISKAINKAGIITSVGYNWRYSDMTDLAHQQLKDRPIGLVVGYWMGGLPGVAWWRKKSMSGGQIVEQTTHIFDMARHLAGEVDVVYSAAGLQVMGDVEGLDVEDASAVSLKFANGAPGVIISTCMLSQGYRVMISVFSKDLALEHTQDRLRISVPGETREIKSKVNPYELEDAIFVEAVSKGDDSKIRCPYDEALKTHRLTMAANRSIETGQPVRL